MAKIVLFLCMLSFGFCAAKIVKFTVCEGKTLKGKLSELEIIPCEAEPCGLKRGTNVTMKAHFTPYEEVKDAKSVVHAKVAGFSVRFPLPNPEACHDSGLTCPLKANGTYVLNAILPVKSEYPKISAPVTWELQDSNKNDIFCFVISIHIE
ncbi:NPC intracellular cholesterol transporter 2 homolog a [Exaiptasia diaphana]|uniref:MD-2-related lipid-recognition domain-containing protein n=1 Tax=Exaiptasia diaphana TaxID=2652724 RepID=A0A913X082_EXADI|nr:NPC intracellular cholesterol transporter 2 homolog a [Exaiptasia diaphana]KXJ29919.1 Protein NPC2-like [Exaiptasia diaphana]